MGSQTNEATPAAAARRGFFVAFWLHVSIILGLKTYDAAIWTLIKSLRAQKRSSVPQKRHCGFENRL